MAAIRAAPDSADQFAWGHPYRHWSSFFGVEPGDELVRSRARVYLAFGTADISTPPLSQEVAVAKLMAAGRDVTVRRVPDADHSLIAPGEDLSALDREYRRALDWFWADWKP
jgi:acetyl esterase/lipase